MPRPIAVFVLVLTLCVSCRTGAPLPAADFSAPGWTVQQGQAVWRPTRSRPELAGDLLLATNVSGDFVAQFTKTPFNMAEARQAGGVWKINFGGTRYSWTGRGEPPARFAWFQLPRLLGNRPSAGHWTFHRAEDGGWSMTNSRTGETLEGFLAP